MHTRNFVRATLASSMLIGLAMGCGSSPDTAETDLGSATIALTSVPPDTSCIRITVSGSRSVVQKIGVAAGKSSVFTLDQLPAGNDTFFAEAFSSACSSVGAQSVPTWVSDAITAFVQNNRLCDVALNMHKNGRAKVSVNFDDAGAECAVGTIFCPSGCANLATDPANCGSCGAACPAGSSCTAGVCVLTCSAGTTDCNGDGVCETSLNDPHNCGGCGNVCPGPAHSVGTCDNGVCGNGWSCTGGYMNCNLQSEDGCESNLTDAANCGGCGVVCASGVCRAGVCKPACPAGTLDCDGDDVCETSANNPRNCGGCGVVCPGPAHSVGTCDNGVCGNGWSCTDGYMNCNLQSEDGCESNLTDAANCGGCGIVCTWGTCSAGVCR
jgi:hypothetical protein